MKHEQLYINVYRTGGTANFKWNECVPVYGKAEAKQQKEELERMGYKTYTYKYEQYKNIGAPETYDVNDPLPGADL